MPYTYNKRKGYFTRTDIVEEQKRDAIKSIAIVLLAMLLVLSVIVNIVLLFENRELQEEIEIFVPNYITGVENV